MPTGVYARRVRVCDVADCGIKHFALGFCSKHYARFKAHGDPLGGGASVRPFLTRDAAKEQGVDCQECTSCGKNYPLSHFRYRMRFESEFYERRCRTCNQEDNARWRRQNMQKSQELSQRYRVRSAYGADGLELLDRILAGAPCDACGAPAVEGRRRHHIDHDHSTGEVRGILCHGCNTALGLLEEDVERMQRLIRYIDASKNAARKKTKK